MWFIRDLILEDWNLERVIGVGESIYTYFMVDSDKLKDGLHFCLQYVDSMKNEYIQEYDIKMEGNHIEIDCEYPTFLK